jgi:hypothetical protein
MSLTPEMLISISSAVIALASALFAWQAVRTAEKTYTVELIGQLYTLYQSDEMLRSLKITWENYKQVWIKESESQEAGITKANSGIPIPLESAILFFKDLDIESAEFKAIHYTINFWTYLELLLKTKALKPQEVNAFTSPYILGFLVPMSKAYSKRFPDPVGQDSTLEYAYEVLVARKR